MEGVPTSTLETTVERDLYQFFAPNQTPRSEPDATLSAFAQLATLRLNTARALVSFVDRTNQYILVEATQKSRLIFDSHSDSLHTGKDGLLFGPTTLPRSQGLCGHALKAIPTSLPKVESGAAHHISSRQPPFVINDLWEDVEFKNHPFVTSHPSLRFYAAVPMRTKSGFTIGTLSVVDDSPRDGLSDVEVEFLGDMAATVMGHLEMTRTNEGHRRSEKMIRGLGTFMEGRTNMDDWWRALGNSDPQLQPPRDPPSDGAEVESIKENGLRSEPALATKTHSPRAGTMGAEAPHLSSSPPVVTNTEKVGAEAEAGADRSAGGLSVPVSQVDTDDAVSAVSKLRRREAASPASLTSNAAKVAAMGMLIPDFEESLKSQRLKEMFSRAVHIIQDSNEVGGAIFLDTTVNTLSGQTASVISGERDEPSQDSTANTDPSEMDSGSEKVLQSLDEALAGVQDAEKRRCGVLGMCAGESLSERGDAAPELVPVTEAFLQSLIHKYPHGHIFNPGEQLQVIPSVKYGTAHTPADAEKSGNVHGGTKRLHKPVAENTEDDVLLQMLPGARSIAFVPLWDSHREKWFAGSFMWTTQETTRILTRTEDLNYLSAFGTSIMAEVARLDVVDADRAKSDFISSISHELRSPLHGILASVEFLRETTVDLFQLGMVDTVERCGRTLLDTIQHVLDFSKINNFNTPKGGAGPKSRDGRPLAGARMASTLGVDIDISLLAEDVVDSVFAGHVFQGNSSFAVTDEESDFPSESRRIGDAAEVGGDSTARNQHGLKRERIEVIMDVGWRPNWTFSTQSGALRRVLMNLFGNSLKYTSSGWVKISLQAEDIESKPSEPDRSVITISVRDSGRGISQEYLNSGLFVPFTQENPLNPGTGLGLSIVLQIVRSLGGTIDITSEEGVGTEVLVTLTMDQAQKGSPLPRNQNGESIIQEAKRNTSGLTIGLLGLDGHGRGPESESSLFLEASVEEMATYWFDMKVVAPSTWKTSPPDIYVVDETQSLHGALAGAPTIVLCSHETLYREYSQRKARGGQSRSDGLIHFVTMPCGPYKLAKAFAFCLGDGARLPLATPGALSTTLSSPQSLFRKSPEEPMHSAGHQPRDDYFPFIARPEKRKPLLLLVDDNNINLRLLSTFVRKNRYEYDTAENGLKALQACQNSQKPYDIVFMDISMPVMDGLTATREIRTLERDRKQDPAMIIALTGLGSAASQQEAFSSGVDLFLTKPARFSDLKKIMHDWNPVVKSNGKPPHSSGQVV